MLRSPCRRALRATASVSENTDSLAPRPLLRRAGRWSVRQCRLRSEPPPSQGIGWAIRAIGKAIDAIPGISGGPIIRAGQKIIDGAEATRKKLEGMSFTDAMDNASSSAQKLADSLSNVPQVFDLALRRMQANRGVSASPTPAAPSIPTSSPAPRPPSGGGGGTGPGGVTVTVVLEAGAVQAGDVAGGMAQVSAAVAAGLRQLGSEVGRAVDEHVVRSLATNARVRLAVKTAAV